MKIYELKKTQHVLQPLEKVFDFFSKPENLAQITPASVGFKILTPAPIQMEKGRLIDYTIKVLGFEQRWSTLITEYNPPHSFVDEQLKGPYAFWHHTHLFESKQEGTQITDIVRYAMPFGFFGQVAREAFVKYELERIFDYRGKQIANIFRIENKNASGEICS